MTLMTVKGRGYFCHWNLTLKKWFFFCRNLISRIEKHFFSRKSNFANCIKSNFLRKFNFANFENSNFSREFNFANLENSNFSREFTLTNSRLIRETREIFFPRKFLPLRYMSKNILSQERNLKVQLFPRNLLYNHFRGKEVEWLVSFYHSKTFLIMPNKHLYFSMYDLIYMLFENNRLMWNLQFHNVGLLVEVSTPSSTVFYYYFYYFDSFCKHGFSPVWYFFIFCINHGSLSSTVNVLCGIKLENIFKTGLLRINDLLLTLVFAKTLLQASISIACLIRSIFSPW